VEYEARFAVSEDQCRTGIIYSGPSEDAMPCRGIVRTRSTQSTRECHQWLIHGYHLNEPVKVQYDPNGSEIKIAGEPIWLRFNFDRLVVNAIWVLAFGVVYVFAQHRLEYFKGHSEIKTGTPNPESADPYKLTTIDLA